MSTTQTPKNPIDAAREVAEHAIRVARLELELKTIELRGKAMRIGIGAGLGLAAVLLVPLLAVFGLAVIAALLATTMKVWLAILIVTGILLVLILGLAGAAAKILSGARKGRDG